MFQGTIPNELPKRCAIPSLTSRVYSLICAIIFVFDEYTSMFYVIGWFIGCVGFNLENKLLFDWAVFIDL